MQKEKRLISYEISRFGPSVLDTHDRALILAEQCFP